MSDVYTWIEPGEFWPGGDPGTNREVNPTDSELIAEVEAGTYSFRSNPLYIGPVDTNIMRNVHSTMRNNSFYKALMQVIIDERKWIFDYAYVLKTLYDFSPMGDQELFLKKVENAISILNANFPTYFKAYINSEDPSFLLPATEDANLNLQNRWLRILLYSETLVRRYAGSRYAYMANFARLQQPGTIYLRATYGEAGIGSPLYGKYYRSKSNTNLTQILPTYQSGVWPNTPSHFEAKEQYTADMDLVLWDTERTWDENQLPGPTGEVAIWDMVTTISPGGKGLMLEYNLDRLRYHTNSFGTTMCLIDEPWYVAMEDLLQSSSRIGDPLMLGSQMTLVGNAQGSISLYTDDPDGIDRDTYTHPNVKARFQIYDDVWLSGNAGAQTISRIETGDGGTGFEVVNPDDITPGVGPDTFWILATDLADPGIVAAKKALRPDCTINPLFSTYVGVREQKVLENNTCLNVSCHKIEIQNQILDTVTARVLGQSADPAGIKDYEVITITALESVTAAGAGNLEVTIRDVSTIVALANDDTPLIIGAKILAALELNTDITDVWTTEAGATDDIVVLTAIERGYITGSNVYADTVTTAIFADTPEGSIDVSLAGVIEFPLPHINLAPGTCTFDIRFSVAVDETIPPSDDTIESYIIRVTEAYNSFQRDFNTEATLYRIDYTPDPGDSGLRPLEEFRLIDYMTDKTYSEEEDYFPNYVDGILDMQARDLSEFSTVVQGRTYSACKIDYEAGVLRMYVKLHADGRWGSANTKSISFSTTCNYSLNSFGSVVSLKQLNKVSTLLVGINEVAIYNSETEPKIVAYGVFPPIIYNPDERHLSFNIAMANSI